MTDIYQELEKELPNYINQIKNRTNSEAKILHEFTSFIQKVYNIEAKDLDFEVSVKSSVKQVKGRMDAVFSNIILEFKKDLKDVRALATAKEELEKYFQSLYEENSKIKHIGIATDGLNFKVYQAIIENEQVSKIEQINEIDLDISNTEKIFNWFDSYFFASTKIIPTSEHLKQTFGLNSPTFAVVKQDLLKLYDKIKVNRSIQTKYNNWERFLEIVYGDKPNEIDLFITHTYLSTFAKLLVYLKIKNKNQTWNLDITSILWGNGFSQLGITGFVEDDFFTWTMFVTIRKQSTEIFEKILKDLEVYDLEKMEEDVLKELYQEMVRADVRKQLGEFYTPDWLAEKIIHETLQEEPKKSILDPTCGSGTFLFKTISYKIKKLRNSGMTDFDILSHILENVTGFDIHPLAIVIAKTNYMLALKEIIQARKGPITIPVFLSDSLKIPEKKIEVTNSITTFDFDTEIQNKKFSFPERIAEDVKKMDDIIEKMKIHGHELDDRIEASTRLSFVDMNEVLTNLKQSFERSISFIKNENEKQILLKNIQTLFELIIEKADSIWPYILRNMYKPITYTGKKVDIIIGNPPWIAQQAIKNESYQNFLKLESKKYDLVDSKKIHNIANLELASLFFCHCCDQYLKDTGSIAFVMPRSILIGSQHEKFLKFKKPQMNLRKILDLEKVTPLFRIPSCVLFADTSSETNYPVLKENISGKLPSFNSQLDKIGKIIETVNEEYTPAKRSTDHSYYHKKFAKGADIIPRSFWFMTIKNDSMLGFNPESPLVESEYNKYAKFPWSEVKITGNIDKQFLFNTILSTDIVPFGCMKRHLVFLPIFVDKTVKIINNSNELGLEYSNTKNMVQEIEKMWIKHNKEKSKQITAYEWVNYRNKLTLQNPFSEFKVLYVASATYLTCFVVKPKESFSFNIGDKKFNTSGFFADSTILYYDTDSEDEAFYLSSILNSTTLDKMIKPLQSAGSFGPRHIMKIPLTFPIPKFDINNIDHVKLVKLGILCHSKTKKILPTLNYKSTGKIRGVVRTQLKNEYEEIDKIVLKLFKK